jgi:hypothetical protein
MPAVAVQALPFELRLAVGVALRQAPPPSHSRNLVHHVLRKAQPLVRAALAPVPLPHRVRYRAPAVALGTLPFHQRQTVDVGLGQAAPALPGGVALDFVDRELAHRKAPLVCDAPMVARRATAPQ